MYSWMKGAFAAAGAALLAATPASAATYILNPTGTVSNGTTASVDGFGFRFDFFQIELQGLTPLTLAVGDDVQANILFDQSITVPTASAGNFVRFYLFNSVPGSMTTTGASGTTDLFNMGSPVLSGPSGGGSSEFVFNSLFNPTGPTFTFDEMQSNFTVDALSDPTLDVDRAAFDYVLRTPLPAVPEPATWAMMFVGFGFVGFALRRRRGSFGTYNREYLA